MVMLFFMLLIISCKRIVDGLLFTPIKMKLYGKDYVF